MFVSDTISCRFLFAQFFDATQTTTREVPSANTRFYQFAVYSVSASHAEQFHYHELSTRMADFGPANAQRRVRYWHFAWCGSRLSRRIELVVFGYLFPVIRTVHPHFSYVIEIGMSRSAANHRQNCGIPLQAINLLRNISHYETEIQSRSSRAPWHKFSSSARNNIVVRLSMNPPPIQRAKTRRKSVEPAADICEKLSNQI